MLIIFSGGSGVGKNTVIEHLIAHGGFALMPTYTTRARRPNESEGHPYHFLSDAEFEAKLREGEFYEHQQVHGHYYGTSKKLLRESLATGKILLKDIDVLGTQNLVRAVGEDLKIVTIFLKVDSSDVLAERLNESVLTVMRTLTDYEARGIVERLPDGRYTPTQSYLLGHNG